MRAAVVVCCAVAVAASAATASPSGNWTAIDLLRLARQRYPAFVGVEPIGFGASREALWTARKPNAVARPRRYTDSSLQHVFAWQDGKTRDLGSFGESDNHVIAVNDHDQIAVSRFSAPPLPPGAPRPLPPRAFLWQHGTFTDLGTLGGDMITAAAINDRPQIVGSSTTRNGDSHAFLWQRGNMTDLGTLGGTWSAAAAINDRGQVVGSSATREGGGLHAFLWQQGKITDLGTLGGRDSEALAIDDSGRILGVSAKATSPKEMDEAVLWENGKATDLGVRVDPYRINLPADGGVVVGTTGNAGAPQGFVWRNGKLTLLGSSIPTGVDTRGDVVGGTGTRAFRAHAFLWRDGSLTLLPGTTLPSTPRLRIDRTGTRIVGESDENAGLRRRVLLWVRNV